MDLQLGAAALVDLSSDESEFATIALINMGPGRAEDARNLWLEAPEIQNSKITKLCLVGVLGRYSPSTFTSKHTAYEMRRRTESKY